MHTYCLRQQFDRFECDSFITQNRVEFFNNFCLDVLVLCKVIHAPCQDCNHERLHVTTVRPKNRSNSVDASHNERKPVVWNPPTATVIISALMSASDRSASRRSWTKRRWSASPNSYFRASFEADDNISFICFTPDQQVER